MLSALIKLLPIFIFGFIGWLLRNKNIVNLKAPSRLLKFGFFVLAPFIVFQAMASIEYRSSLIVFPIFALLLGAFGFIAGVLTTKNYEFDNLRKIIVIMSAMFVNVPFALTFLLSRFGTEVNSRVILFNIINLPIVYGLGHFLAARSNPEKHKEKPVLKKIMFSSPLWGLLIGFAFSLTSLKIPKSLNPVFNSIAILIVIVASLAIGMFITFSKKYFKESIIAMTPRYVTSMIIALIFVSVLDLAKLETTIILVLGCAPVGFSTLTFAHLEKLDEKFAANTLGLSLLISCVLTSAVLILTS